MKEKMKGDDIMRKDVENQIYMMGGEMMNKSEIARRFSCS